MPRLIAYHGRQADKDAILAQLRQHAELDQIVKGQYWQYGRGCAVGCTIYSGDHAEYEPRFGIPKMLARLEDTIFEGLDNGLAQQWPIRFMSAVKPGSDLSVVGWQFLHWLITTEAVNPGINHPSVRNAVARCAKILAKKALGKSFTSKKARSVASAAYSAAESAESAAESAENEAFFAADSAGSAVLAVYETAPEAFLAAEAVTSAISAADDAATSAVYAVMADKLIEFIEAVEC